MRESFESQFVRNSWQGAPLLDEYADTLRIREQIRKLGHEVGAVFDLRCARDGRWIVFQKEGQKERLVGIYEQLDSRIVNSLRRVVHHTYTLSKEMDNIDMEHEKLGRARVAEITGEASEKLAYHTRRLVGDTSHVFVPRGVGT